MPNQTEKLPPSVSVTKSVRRYDLDWLRVFAVLVLLCFHSARPFDEWGWHIKNETVSGFITNIPMSLTLADWFVIQVKVFSFFMIPWIFTSRPNGLDGHG